ncbi:MAG TPA: hypothetical protein VLW45_13375 [Pelomicrobium sp.]|nr:hypothetical protein [Pelomicrobium sp.]
MARSDLYDRIFEYPPDNVATLMFTDPDQVEKDAGSREVAAWELLLGSMQLRRAGQRSPANDWLNHATRVPVKSDVFKAELLGEAGQGLLDSDRLQDAFKILNSAEAIWRDVCEQADDACRETKPGPAAEFATHLLPLFVAARAKPPASEAAIRGGGEAVPMVRQWLSERAVVGRAQTANSLLRVLAKGGRVDDARRVLAEEKEWIARNFTAPAKPAAALPLERRTMSPAVRRALYLLLLAEGEVELAAEAFERSAAGFAAAAALFENKVQD